MALPSGVNSILSDQSTGTKCDSQANSKQNPLGVRSAIAAPGESPVECERIIKIGNPRNHLTPNIHDSGEAHSATRKTVLTHTGRIDRLPN